MERLKEKENGASLRMKVTHKHKAAGVAVTLISLFNVCHTGHLILKGYSAHKRL